MQDVYTTGIPYYQQDAEVNVLKNGALTTCYFNLSYKPMLNNLKEVYGVLTAGVDVTEMVLSNKELKESERNFRNLIIQALIGICIIGGEPFYMELSV